MTNLPRVDALVRRFQAIDESMRDLPIYNPAIRVAGVGFRPFEEGYLGVLVTPWFMNMVLLGETRETFAHLEVGSRLSREFPAGERRVVVGEEGEGIGRYLAAHLASPMSCYHSQDQARAAGLAALEDALCPVLPPADQAAAGEAALGQAGMARRRLLRGGLRPGRG